MASSFQAQRNPDAPFQGYGEKNDKITPKGGREIKVRRDIGIKELG
jgi:hypothetical protein